MFWHILGPAYSKHKTAGVSFAILEPQFLEAVSL